MSMFENDRADESEMTGGKITNNGDGTFDIEAGSAVMPDTTPDGVYFNLPEAEYHALPRLSASGIKNILTSLPTFWAKSWMNPDKADDDEDTKAQILGRAYHCAIFEAGDLHNRYVGEPDWSSFRGLIETDTAVKARLKELGEPQTKTGELALDRARRLRDMGCEAPIKSIIQAEFLEDLDDRQPIKDKYWRQIQRDVQRIEENPEIHDLVSGGASEVSILWTCPETGIPMKARIDKLKPACFVDLKSFANANGKPVNQAIADQVRYYQYYLSMRMYQEAIAMIRVLNLQCQDMRPEMWQKELIDHLRGVSLPHQPWLFFQEKNGIPNLLARRLKLYIHPDGVDEQSIGAENHDIKANPGALCHKADIEIAHAKKLFLQAMTIYGTEQEWYPLDMIGDIGDEDFSDFFLDAIPS